MAKKRERLEIIKDSRKIKPTRLLYASNLSPQMFKDYVDELLNKNFVQIEEEDKGKKTFLITNKGRDFLNEYKEIENFIENFGL